uniref:Phosphatidylethanolamine N-methyltransferase n=1 Tax=Saccoglossus kowalevskii TaxID=10224 RepID=A0ABM0LWI0_SACKO|nr:PREDICTED: phosphatidylethanolamine N-methyltransferase-like [Saccoglossus kowalevskii]
MDSAFINWQDSNLYIAGACILFNPIFWNIVARYEFRSQFLSRSCGSPFKGCILLGITIILLGIFRDFRYQVAIDHQPKLNLLDTPWMKLLAIMFITAGVIFIFSSYWALGFTGTFLGDYFGILMKERVTCFPFNVTDNPMYWGSVLNFLGVALWNVSPAGFLLTALVAGCYKFALFFEEPFTAEIYQRRGENKKK